MKGVASVQSASGICLVHDVKQQLDAIVERIVATVPTDEIILFGSYVNGVPDDNSDLDICILTSIEGTRTPKWFQAVRRAIRPVTALPIDLLMWPRVEFERNSRHPSSFERVIAESGVRLYG